MKKVTFPFNDTKTMSLSGGGTISWPLARLPQKLKNGRGATVRAFTVEFIGTLGQAATAAEFSWSLFWLIVSQLRIARVGGQPKIKITGFSWRVWNAVTNLGIDRGAGVLPVRLAAQSGGSALTRTFSIRLSFRFDTPGLKNKNYFVKAAKLFESGALEIDYKDPTTAFGTGYTFATSLTANLYAELGAERHGRDGVDIELFNLSDTTTASGSTLAIPRGSYPFIVMACEKIGTTAGVDGLGGDDHTLFSAIQSTNFFPEELPSLSGIQLRDRYLADQMDGQAESLVAIGPTKLTAGQCLPLVYPEAFGDLESAALKADQEWSLSTTLSGSLSVGHRLLLGRVLPRNNEDLKTVACVHKVDMVKGTLQAEVDPSDPITEQGSHFAPMRVRSDQAPSNMRQSGARLGPGRTGGNCGSGC